MNIWDSVHRGLDKASKEAGRIARIQRTRLQIDKLSRQINTQEGSLLQQAMELFTSGQLIQSELLPICHELMILHQQLTQAQNELQALHSQGPATPQPGQPPLPGTQDMYVPQTPTQAGDLAETAYIPPSPTPAYPVFDQSIPAVPPPPPPPVNMQALHSQETILDAYASNPAENPSIVSSQETLRIDEGQHKEEEAQSSDNVDALSTLIEGEVLPNALNQQRCPHCNVATLPGYLFCHNCGTALLQQGASHQPTVRAAGSSFLSSQETIRSSSDNHEPLQAHTLEAPIQPETAPAESKQPELQEEDRG